MGKSIFIGVRKDGVGKTMTTTSLGVGLVREGKKTLVIDADGQHSLTIGLGVKEPDKLPVTLTTVMNNIISDINFDPTIGIIHHVEGVDLLPANSLLAGIELALAPLIGRETILRQYIEIVKPLYDFILIDTVPSFDLITINALATTDSVIIPVVPKPISYQAKRSLRILLSFCKPRKSFCLFTSLKWYCYCAKT